MPHIKTFARASNDGKRLAWFWLTSSNLSKSAQGNLQKQGKQVHLNHWETGVLFTPESLRNAGADFCLCEDSTGRPVASHVPFFCPSFVERADPPVLVTPAADYEQALKEDGAMFLLPVPYDCSVAPRYEARDQPWEWKFTCVRAKRERSEHQEEGLMTYKNQS